MTLTREEWEATPYPARLLLHAGPKDWRKLRLFMLHCVARLSSIITRPAVREALVVAERFADGDASGEELREGWLAVRAVQAQMPTSGKWGMAYSAASHATAPEPWAYTHSQAARMTALALDCPWIDPDEDPEAEPAGGPDEMAFQCAVLRDLFPWTSAPLNIAWLTADARSVAHAIYPEGRWQDTPILADALEETGCDEVAILSHLRESRLHWKGCWAVDAVLFGAGVLPR